MRPAGDTQLAGRRRTIIGKSLNQFYSRHSFFVTRTYYAL
ncbi:Uncharacterised protein [Enterobacter cancerogenus]|jgi:hypothetical protein|uniref:Uncharacterized protein n=1 Tax=Enterobacter cancerogenus TaxID=69218 RepID=A0A484XLB4_9ENTR|nr:Uncharacterised protein [Enterobacter cancerogenus]